MGIGNSQKESGTTMRSLRIARLAPLAALAATLAVLIGASPAQATLTYQTSFGATGEGSGEFQNPRGVAVNPTTGNVYVTDRNLNRVSVFDADGNFLFMFGQGVNQTTGGDVCTAASGDTCQAGAQGDTGGAFSQPGGIGIDPNTGAVFVQDTGNQRIQKFTADGSFVLTWGKDVNQTTGGNRCTAASGDTCQAGGVSGDENTNPPIDSAPGEFGDWSFRGDSDGPNLAVDPQGNVYVGDRSAVPWPRVQKFDSDGNFISQVGPPTGGFQSGGNANGFDEDTIGGLQSIAVNASGDLYARDASQVHRFPASTFTATGLEFGYDKSFGPDSTFSGLEAVAIDPYNQFLFAGYSGDNFDSTACDPNDPAVYHVTEFHPSGQTVDCTDLASPPVNNDNGGMAISPTHRLYLVDTGHDTVRVYQTPVASPPTVGIPIANHITSKSARLNTDIAANIGDTTYHVEYGTEGPCSSNPCASTDESESIGAAYAAVPITYQLQGLNPDTRYYYRFAVTNSAGTVHGPDREFTTFPSPLFDPSCSNNLARQQTGAAFLLDCRAYELVSAADTGGYNVESNLVPGQKPFAGFPEASGKALYAVQDGGIPNTGLPTNRGPDPYVATRDEANKRWNTRYVGVPADAPSDAPFSSTLAGADQSLDTFAFSGPEICDPCFADGSAGIPLRLRDGSLVQGMAGSIPVSHPQPAGTVKKPLSADGSHFVFGSKQQFEDEGNDSGTDVTIYDRDLAAGTTQVASTLPGGATIADGENVAELDISADGSRILIGDLLDTDSQGNKYWHLYMHVGSAAGSVDLTPGTSQGVQYAGMSADGSKVYFTTPDALTSDDHDTSADLFRADVSGGSASLTRVSTGSGAGDTDSCDPAGNSFNSSDWNVVPGGPTDCSVVAIGGGGGVASGSGTVFFLSPEKLDGNGTAGAPNLFEAAPGEDPSFVATLESEASRPLPPGAHVREGSFSPFSTPAGAAVDRSNGDVYLLDLNAASQGPGVTVTKVDANGNTVSGFGDGGVLDGSGTPEGGFTGLADGTALGLPGGAPLKVAVDNDPGSPSYRDLYVPDLFNSKVDKFDPDGTLLSQLSVTFPTAVAVNPSNGDVYVLSLLGTVYVFHADGTPGTPASFSAGGAFRTDMAVSSSGTSYVVQPGSAVRIYDSTGTASGTLDPNASYGVSVDPADDHVYVDEGSKIVEFDSSGTQLATFGSGEISGSYSLAADSGRVVVSNKGGGNFARFSALITPPGRGYDNPLVIDSVRNAGDRKTADFQVNRSGEVAAFPSALSLTGFDSVDHFEVFRYATGDGLVCISCNPTQAQPSSDSSLASNGLSITDDGRVFFDSGEPLVLRDTNERQDAYEWKAGKVELISTGKNAFDSRLLGASADGTDAFFFTRERLVDSDQNGTLVRLYDARANGGFFTIPPAPPCAASDECHGPGTLAPAAAKINSGTGDTGNYVAPKAKQKPKKKRCKRGKVRRHGKCVRKKRHHRRHHRGKKHRRGAKHHRPTTRRHG